MTGIRLVPVTLVVAALLLAVKTGDVWQGTSAWLGEFTVSPALAQEPPSEEAEGEPPPPTPPPSEPAAAASVQQLFTEAELEMLQNLVARRQQLDQRQAELDLRESLLEVAGQRIDERIAELDRIEETIRALLVQHDEQSEAQLQSVVAIYTAMKPKDAAVIFNSLNMAILLDIADRMRERTMAPILAEMDPVRADELTVQLATRRALPEFGAATN